MKFSLAFIVKRYNYLLFIISCTFSDFTQNTEDMDLSDSLKKIIIVSTNDLEGHLYPTRKTHHKYENHLEVGGGEIFSSYINIIKRKNPGEILLLDSGNLFFNMDDKKKTKKILSFLNYMQYDGILFSEKEFLALDKNTFEYLTEYPVPFINSNIMDLKKSSLLKDKKINPWKLISMNDLSIGIIGVTDPSTLTYEEQLKGIYFEDPILSIIKAKKELKKKGAHIIILLTRVKSTCRHLSPEKYSSSKQFSNFQLQCSDPNDPLVSLIERFPPDTIDIIITGDTNTGDGFIGKIPVLQNPGRGSHFSKLELFYDTQNKKIIHGKTMIHPPIKLCLSFFKDTHDCNERRTGLFDRIFMHRKEIELIPARFSGAEISRDSNITQLLQSSQRQTKTPLSSQ